MSPLRLLEHLERSLAALPRDLTRRQAFAGLALCSLVAAWMTSALWGPGLPAGSDMARHYWRARVESDLFVATGHIDGWSPYWHLGLQQFLFQSYGYYFLIALAERLVGSWCASLTIFKFFLLLPFYVLPWVVYGMSRRLGILRWSSLLGAFTVLGVAVGTGFGIKGWYATGLMLQAPGVLLVGASIVTAIPGLRRGGAALAATAAITGIALVTHLISGAYILSALTIYALGVSLAERSLRPLGRGAAVILLALGVAAHVLLRSMELESFMGAPVGWGSDGPIGRILAAGYFASTPVSLLAYFGTFHALVARRPGLFAVALLFAGTALFAGSPHFTVLTDGLTSLADTVFRPRAMPAACLLFPIVLAYGLETVVRLARNSRLLGAFPRVVVLLLAVVVVASGTDRIRSLARIPRTVRPTESITALPYHALLDYLREHAEPHAVVAFEMDIFEGRESGSPRFASLLNDETGLYALGGDQSEATDVRHHRMISADRLADAEPDHLLAHLRHRSVSWLAVRTPKALARARALPGLELALTAGSVELYRVAGKHRFLTGQGLAVRELVAHEPERIVWEVRNRKEKGVAALLAVSRHPNWRGWIDGGEVELEANRDRLMTVDIPPGNHRLEIRWLRPARERLYNLISILACAIIALVALAGRPGNQPSWH